MANQVPSTQGARQPISNSGEKTPLEIAADNIAQMKRAKENPKLTRFLPRGDGSFTATEISNDRTVGWDTILQITFDLLDESLKSKPDQPPVTQQTKQQVEKLRTQVSQAAPSDKLAAFKAKEEIRQKAASLKKRLSGPDASPPPLPGASLRGRASESKEGTKATKGFVPTALSQADVSPTGPDKQAPAIPSRAPASPLNASSASASALPLQVPSTSADSAKASKETPVQETFSSALPPVSFVGPDKKAYPLYPASRDYAEAKGEDLYVEPMTKQPEPKDKIFTKQSPTTTPYENAQACMFVIQLFRTWREQLLSINSQDIERARHFTYVIEEITEMGVQIFLNTVRNFSGKDHSLSIEDFEKPFCYFSNTLKELALTVHPPFQEDLYEQEVDKISNAISQREEELQQANDLLEALEKTARRNHWLSEETLEDVCKERDVCFHGPIEAREKLNRLEVLIEETDFSKGERDLFSPITGTIDKKFSSLKKDLSNIDSDIKYAREFGMLGYMECEQTYLKVSSHLVEKARPHYDKLSKDGKRKFDGLVEMIESGSITSRPRASTVSLVEEEQKE